MEEFIQKIMQTRLVESIITIVISIVLYRIFNKIIVKGKKNKNIDKKLDNRQRTYIKLFSNILKYAFIILTILIAGSNFILALQQIILLTLLNIYLIIKKKNKKV